MPPRTTTGGRPAGSATNGADTRARIVTAAAQEFAEHGIAGARVDRIAQQARTSKERVYAYFRSKEELYAHIASQELAVIAKATQLDAADLPGYAGRLFDHYAAHPEHHRLITWGRLEITTRSDSTTAVIAAKLDKLRHAQQAGKLETHWDPVDVLALVNQIATTWAAQPDLSKAADEHATDRTLAARRAAVVTAVERLFPRAT
ncbi:TetR/AcrR family transcriptional regulator [Catenuloplanes japonicus]|uniref:TetR/AcrR family transcriptional regulator n=1 Tax=Catenuloplanes japonicus TaxID=33876 RepID=UPI00069004E7|nr:TetR family transcriptional regulator [Catenuloplanes japonicus]